MTIIDNVWDITQRDALGNLQHAEPVRMNPLSIIETYDIRQEINRTLSDVKVTLTPISGLNIDITTGFDTYAQQGFEFHDRIPYAGVSGAILSRWICCQCKI